MNKNKENTNKKKIFFCYGTLKSGHGNHRLLENSKFIANAISKEKKYSLYHLGGFPGLKSKGNTKVTGELYEIDEETHQRLRYLEGYPNHYYEEDIVLTTDNNEEITAFTYIYNCEPNENNLIENGTW